MNGAVRPVIVSNEVPFLQMRSVGSHSTSGREKEGIKERIGWEYQLKLNRIKKPSLDGGQRSTTAVVP